MSFLKDKKCIFCKSDNTESIPAKLAPFIKARIEENQDLLFNLIHCKNCGGAFYDYRYSEEQVEKIYKNYRSDEYQESRQKFDAWYSKEFNDLLQNDPKAVEGKKKNLAEILENNTNVDLIKTVLDYGGDKGQYIPEILNKADRYVFDISCRDVVDGIIPIRTIEDCRSMSPKGYDLIILAQVLEHLTDPDGTIKIAKNLLSENGLVYIELPFDSPFYKRPQDNIKFLFSKYFKLKDIIKKYIEIKKSKYNLMHEHINFYTEKSLEYTLNRNGFKIMYSKIRTIPSSIGGVKVICMLAAL